MRPHTRSIATSPVSQSVSQSTNSHESILLHEDLFSDPCVKGFFLNGTFKLVGRKSEAFGVNILAQAAAIQRPEMIVWMHGKVTDRS